MCLKMQLPFTNTSRPVRLGVVLAPMDNPLGQEINQYVCRIVRRLSGKEGGGKVDEPLARLNRLLAGGR